MTGGRKQRWRQAERRGGKLRVLGMAPRHGHFSNFGGLSDVGDVGTSTACSHLDI
jgi:hypothetical protein